MKDIDFVTNDLTVNCQLDGVLQCSVHNVGVLRSAGQHLLIISVVRRQTEHRLGDVVHVVGDVLGGGEEDVPQPPGHHWVRSGPSSFTLHQVFLASREWLSRTDDADI